MVKYFYEYHMDLNLGEIIYIRHFLNWTNAALRLRGPGDWRLFEFAVFSGHIFEKEFFIPPFLSVFHVMYVMLKGLKGPTLFRVQSLSIKYGIYLLSYLSFLT